MKCACLYVYIAWNWGFNQGPDGQHWTVIDLQEGKLYRADGASISIREAENKRLNGIHWGLNISEEYLNPNYPLISELPLERV